jgi:hypothetical protein
MVPEPRAPLTVSDLLSDEELRLLGEVTAYGALIEAIAAGIHGAAAAAPGDPELATASTSGKTVGWLLKHLQQSGDHQIRTWADEAGRAIDGRHRLVHTAWMGRAQIHTGPVGVFGMRSTRHEPATVVEPGEFKRVRDVCYDAYRNGRDLSAILHRVE